MVWMYLSFNLKALRWRLLGQMEGSVTQLVQKEKELKQCLYLAWTYICSSDSG